MSTPQTYTLQTAAQLSAHLKSLRKLRGLTQDALGQRIGVKQVRVADIERNPGAISVDQLFEVLHALNAKLLLADAGSYAHSPPMRPPRAKEPGPNW